MSYTIEAYKDLISLSKRYIINKFYISFLLIFNLALLTPYNSWVYSFVSLETFLIVAMSFIQMIPIFAMVVYIFPDLLNLKNEIYEENLDNSSFFAKYDSNPILIAGLHFVYSIIFIIYTSGIIDSGIAIDYEKLFFLYGVITITFIGIVGISFSSQKTLEKIRKNKINEEIK